ncbi:MAG: tRNA guanosine(15) transglycosylase TgtA [Candidatus Ranarchaeia archaeon]
MDFEIVAQDLAGRIGKLQTPNGVIETPLLFPVVNPTKQTISPKELEHDFGCSALITNAYFLWQRCKREVLEKGIHKFFDFNGTIMTDSGAYQILMYGGVEINSLEVLKFQSDIGSDLGVILDVPTGGGLSRSKAELTVKQTIERAKEAVKYWSSLVENHFIRKKDTLWVGPIQGGLYPDLVTKSASIMASLGFKVFALGSPTPLLEQYLYSELVKMIVAARKGLSIASPLHLFGAGHPMILPLAVALGCDLFDSASYALFARQDRFILPYGTVRLAELTETGCLCPVCQKYTPRELQSLRREERVRALARHNLYVTLAELKKTKQAIYEGRLWEFIQRKASSHPQLLEATRLLRGLGKYIEASTPVTKKRGILYTGVEDFWRPEVLRHHRQIQKWQPLYKPSLLVLMQPENGRAGFYSWGHRRVIQRITSLPKSIQKHITVAAISMPFGFIPWELTAHYPLAQYTTIRTATNTEWRYTAIRIAEILRSISSNLRGILLLAGWPRNHVMVESIEYVTRLYKIPLHLVLTPHMSECFRKDHLQAFIKELKKILQYSCED